MKIADILNEIDVKSSYIPEHLYTKNILSLCHDSRQASSTCAFVCRVGALSDGHTHAMHAYHNGARIFIAERELNLPDDAAVIISRDSTMALCKLSVLFYDNPSSELKIIGVTGTKGKTTIAIALYNLASSYGISAGYIGTNGIYYNGKIFETANTTPDVLELQKYLREMIRDGVTTVFLEVSSQALWQKRTYGINFHTCIFTNLYEDHIGGYEHPTFEHYRDSKKLLFSNYKPQNIVVNMDSPYGSYMIENIDCRNIITTSALGNSNCSIYAKSTMKVKSKGIPGISFEYHAGKTNNGISTRNDEIFMPFPGTYSVENGLLIFAAALLIGIDEEFIVNQLSHLTIPGRFEAITLSSKPNSLFIIDYAHNGASLKSVILALREYSPSRIICLFGSVGGRTFGRRKELGEVAAEYADVIILTSDNPNDENPADILHDIRDAMGDVDKPIYMITERKEAIQKAFEIARDGDYILLAGKGHESYQLISGRRIPFSEKEILKNLNIIYAE